MANCKASASSGNWRPPIRMAFPPSFSPRASYCPKPGPRPFWVGRNNYNSRMAQTLRTLAALLTLAILLTIALGFWSFFSPGRPADKDLYLVHFVSGLTTAIGILFVHCLIFIYFLGTGRWVKEVTLAYRMPDEPWHKTTREL